MTRHVDLDAMLALDEPSESRSFTFRGVEWMLPGDLPIDVLGLTDGFSIWRTMIDEGAAGQLERFDALRPRVRAREIAALDKAYGALYGATVGESSASVES